VLPRVWRPSRWRGLPPLCEPRLLVLQVGQGPGTRLSLAQLSPDARRELIALIWLVQRPLLSFQAALRRTRRIPPAAQPGYLMGIRLERYIAEGLRKLGCGGA
jgi:hypothetical protein